MPHRSTLLLVLLAAVLTLPPSPCILNAQSPGKILVEAFTNMACGPCAEEYPLFDEYVAITSSSSEPFGLAGPLRDAATAHREP